MSRIKKALGKIRTSLFKGAFIHNPILTQAAGVFAVVGGATSLRSSIVLTFTAGVTLLLCEGAASLILKRIPRYLRIAFYALISAAVIFVAEPFMLLLSDGAPRVLPVYFYLMGVNALTVVRCERFAVRKKLRYSILDAFSATAGFGAVALIIGALREAITYGTLLHYAHSAPLLPSGALPFIALALLGLLAALHRAVVIRFYPNEKTETLSFASSNDRFALKDPGLFSRKKKASKSKSADNFDIINLRSNEREGE